MRPLRSSRLTRSSIALGYLVLAGCAPARCGRQSAESVAPISRLAAEPAPTAVRTPGERIVFHAVRLDERGLLLPAREGDAPFAEVAARGFGAFAKIPDAPNGKKPYFSAAMFSPGEGGFDFTPHTWLNNPTGLSAMLVRSSLHWYAYSGDRAPIDASRALVDHVLAHGLTQEGDAWSRVPYASANPGELEYRGGEDAKFCDDHDACGRGDGRGFLEPDKIGEFGHALVQLHRFTGEARYLEAAIRCADQLAAHVEPGDAQKSPWPFRVDAATGKIVRERYTSNWVLTIALFDELQALGKATDAHRAARDTALAWLLKYPVQTMHWQAYFEDIPIYAMPGTNPNQYSAGETARWLLDHPERDPDAIAHARAIVAWIEKTFAGDVDAPKVGKTPGHWYGAEVISEQGADMAKMGSHTARHASVLARLYEATGDASLRERARRSFAWATYCIDDRGVVKVGPDDREGYWFSDGYGDYLIHFLEGIASVPAWAPAGEAHVLRTRAPIVDVAYPKGAVRYRGVAAGTEEIRVPKEPTSVRVGGVTLARNGAGYPEITPMPAGGALVRLKRDAAGEVSIEW
jgi:hypothetical protein